MALRPVAKKVDLAAEVLDGCAVPRGGVGLELARERCQVSPKICKSAHALRRKHGYERLKLAQLLGRLGVFLTLASGAPFCQTTREWRTPAVTGCILCTAWDGKTTSAPWARGAVAPPTCT